MPTRSAASRALLWRWPVAVDESAGRGSRRCGRDTTGRRQIRSAGRGRWGVTESHTGSARVLPPPCSLLITSHHFDRDAGDALAPFRWAGLVHRLTASVDG